MLGWKMGYRYLDTPIDELERVFELQKPHLRRKYADLCLLFKLVNGLMDSPSLLESIDFSVPRGTRSRTVFQRRYCPTAYTYNSGLSRLVREGSVAASEVNFFDITLSSFKHSLRRASV